MVRAPDSFLHWVALWIFERFEATGIVARPDLIWLSLASFLGGFMLTNLPLVMYTCMYLYETTSWLSSDYFNRLLVLWGYYHHSQIPLSYDLAPTSFYPLLFQTLPSVAPNSPFSNSLPRHCFKSFQSIVTRMIHSDEPESLSGLKPRRRRDAHKHITRLGRTSLKN